MRGKEPPIGIAEKEILQLTKIDDEGINRKKKHFENDANKLTIQRTATCCLEQIV